MDVDKRGRFRSAPCDPPRSVEESLTSPFLKGHWRKRCAPNRTEYAAPRGHERDRAVSNMVEMSNIDGRVQSTPG